MIFEFTSWEERPVEVANLLNPAFCALLIRETVKDYSRLTDRSFPLPLAYLILPIVLHESSRNTLPKSTLTLLHNWLQDNPVVQYEVQRRTHLLMPFTKEALLFGLQQKTLNVDDEGGLVNILSRSKNPFTENTECFRCRQSAGFLGRWFSKVSDTSLVLVMWGLKP